MALKNLFLKYGPPVTSHIRFWEKTRLKLDRTVNQSSFLEECLQHSVIPKGFCYQRKFDSYKETLILKNAETQIISHHISQLKKECAKLNSLDVDNCIQVASRVTSQDFKLLIEILNASTKKKFEDHQKGLSRKFQQLLTQKAPSQNNDPRLPNQNNTLSEVKNYSKTKLEQETLSLLSKGVGYGVDTSQNHYLDNLVRLNAFSKNKIELANKSSIVLDKFLEKSTSKKRNSDLNVIQDLRKDKSIKITKSDKGGTLVILNTEDYEEKLDTYISQNYNLIKKDPTNKLQADLRFYLKNTLNWDQKTVLKISPTYPRKPSIYGLPKTHKEDLPLRPIINQRNTVHSNISKFLARGLFDLLPRPASYIKNGKEMSDLLRTKKLDLSSQNHIISIDIKEMYPSIPPRLALKCLKLKLNLVPDTVFRQTLQMEKDEALFLLQSILSSSYFEHNGKFYSQDKGLAMGSPLSPLLADIYMENLEKLILEKFVNKIGLWKRYVDDTLVLWKSSLQEFELFMQYINSMDPHITFTYEIEANESLPFLDLHVKRAGANLTTCFYSKPTAGLGLLHFESYHPIGLKINVAVQKLFKIQDFCSQNEDRLNLKRKLTNDLRNLAYPPKVINRIFASLKFRQQKKSTTNKSRFLPLFFEKTTQKEFQNVFNQPGVKVAWKQQNNILDVYKNPSNCSKNLEKKNAVYIIPCSCSHAYIGETGRPVKIRQKEHQNNVKVKDPDSHLAVHMNKNPTHKILWENTFIIDQEEDNILRKLKEAAYIYLNRDICISRPTLDVEEDWKWILEKYKKKKKIFNLYLHTF